MTNFFLDMISSNNVKFVQVYSCFSYKDRIVMLQAFSQSNIRSSFAFSVVHSNLNALYFIVDVSCERSKGVLKKSETVGHFRSHYKWLLFDSTRTILNHSSDIPTVLSDLHLRLDSDVLVVFQNINSSEVVLYDVYTIGKNENYFMKVFEYGVWTPSSHLILKSQLSKYNTRKNLRDLFLRFGSVNTKPFFNKSLDFHYRDLRDKETDTINKLNYNLFIHLQEIHNFTYNIILVDKWFGNIPGGMDDGLGKLLYDDVVDVGATSALLKFDRIPHYDYIFPTYPFRTSFIFRNSRLSGRVQNEFLKPFNDTLWYAVLICVGLFCLVLKLLFVVGRSTETWHSALILTWGVMCQQGASFVSQRLSGKCALLTMLVMSLMLYNYYTSSIVSSLLSGLPPPINTIDELTNSKLHVGLEDVPYVRTLFEVTNDSTLRKFYKTKVLTYNEPPYVPVSKGLEQVQRGGYAYHTEPHTSYSVVEKDFESHEICELAEINLFSPAVLWTLSKKHSEYSGMFAIGYNKMLEAGIIKRQQLMWMVRKPSCLGNTHLVAVDFDHLLSAFLVLGFGSGLALLILLSETYVYKIFKCAH